MRHPGKAAITVLMSTALLAAACSGGGGDDELEGLPTEPFALDIDVGGCFDQPASPDVVDVPTVGCDVPHDFEVYAIVDLEGDGFPGDEEVAAQALSACNDRFAGYVGRPPDQSGYVVVPVAPSVEGWDAGDRGVTCTVTLSGQDRLESSVEGSEQPEG
jgi:hypothetical protein